jgi:hypothetical protein
MGDIVAFCGRIVALRNFAELGGPKMRSWIDAYKLFLKSREESFGLKILPLVAAGLVPAALADDVLLPFIGFIDDIPTSLFVAFVAWRTWRRVRLYRGNEKAAIEHR